MKPTYTVKLIDDLDPNSVMLDLPQNISLFAAFLVDAIKTREDADNCLELIAKVKGDVFKRTEIFGDIYRLELTKPTASVEDIEDPDVYNSSIRTIDLEELVYAWIDVLNKKNA